MANVYAVKTGNWSDTTVWNTGALPTSADDVFSNTYTVTIDINASALTIGNISGTGITAGGGFVLNGGVTLTISSSSAYATRSNNGTGSVSYLITFAASSPASSTINGNIGGGTVTNNRGINHSGSGTLNINGNIVGPGNGSAEYGYAIVLSGSGTLNIVGNINGGISNYGAVALYLSGSGTANVTGSVTAGSGGYGGGTDSNYAIRNVSNSTVNVTGNVSCTSSPYPAISNYSTGVLTVTGSISGGSAGAVSNDGSGTFTHIGTASAAYNGPAISAGSATQNTYLSGPFIGTSAGIVANGAYKWRWISGVGSSYMTVPNYAGTGYKNLYTADNSSSASGQPAASNVRSGIVYGPSNELTGTCAVPSASNVVIGIPVDNTVGTAVLSAASIQSALEAASVVTLNQQTSSLTTSGSIGERLKLVSTVATVAQQLSDALSNE
jgi:hypothetical protein